MTNTALASLFLNVLMILYTQVATERIKNILK